MIPIKGVRKRMDLRAFANMEQGRSMTRWDNNQSRSCVKIARHIARSRTFDMPIRRALFEQSW